MLELSDGVSQAPTPRHSTVTFKFKDMNGDFHRATIPHTTHNYRDMYQQLSRTLDSKFGASPQATLKVTFIDDEGDEVILAGPEDLEECCTLSVKQASRNIQLRVTCDEKARPTDRGAGVQSPVTVSAENSIVDPECNGGSVPEPPTQVVESPMDEALEQGQEALQREDFEGARRHFSEAIEANDSHFAGYHGRAASHLLLADFANAEKDYRQALQLLQSESSVGEA